LAKPLWHPSKDLSGGEMQRMAIAGVVAMQPQLLLLDEPTSMLDAHSAASVRETVRVEVEARKQTLIVVEHRFEHWLPLVDRVLVLNHDGELILDGEPNAVINGNRRELIELGLWLPGMPAPEPKLIDLGVRARGALTVLTGKSGAGKTTELKRRLADDPLTKTIMTGAGYVPQQAELTIIGNTVFESANLTAKLAAQGHGIEQTEPKRHTEYLLSVLGVADLSEANPYEISGGEQRRVAMATALAHWPLVLYLDEPTVGQDRDSWSAIVGAILSARAAGVKITLATHDPDLIAYADEVIEISPEVFEVAEPQKPVVSGLAVMITPLLLLIGSMAVTSVARGVSTLLVALVSGLILAGFGLKVQQPKVLVPGLVGIASIGFSNWYLSAALAPESGAIAAMRVAVFVLPGILLATQLRAIPFGDQLGQVLRLPARPVVAASAAMQKLVGLLDLWHELRFIHELRGLRIGRGPVARVKEFTRLVFALLLQAIRGAGITAVAMDARGFSRRAESASGKRTWAEAPQRGSLDWLVLGLAALVSVAPIFLV
jgi:energy-coupling factor transport system ATP-binding protein